MTAASHRVRRETDGRTRKRPEQEERGAGWKWPRGVLPVLPTSGPPTARRPSGYEKQTSYTFVYVYLSSLCCAHNIPSISSPVIILTCWTVNPRPVSSLRFPLCFSLAFGFSFFFPERFLPAMPYARCGMPKRFISFSGRIGFPTANLRSRSNANSPKECRYSQKERERVILHAKIYTTII